MAQLFVGLKQPWAAMALAIQMDCYLRPHEVIELDWGSVSRPRSGARAPYNRTWAIIIGDTELGKVTKAKQSDDTVVLGLPSRIWLVDVVSSWHHALGRPTSGPLFPGCTLHSYEKVFRLASAKLNAPTIRITPHVVRHSAPSEDFLCKRIDIQALQKRGRWGHFKSVQRYEKSGRLLWQARRVPADLAARADAAERNAEALLASAVAADPRLCL
jgi:hypothetical protein